MTGEVICDLLNQEPMLVYHKQMREWQEVALPLVNKVIDGKLVLQGYTLDSGHVESLATSIRDTQKPAIESVYLDNCGIDDYELSLLFLGLQKMQGFKRFVYKNNVFLDDSLEQICPLLLRKDPCQLLELRLVNLKTDP